MRVAPAGPSGREDEADHSRIVRSVGLPMTDNVRHAVIFDLDGTLIDTETTYRRAFMAAAATLGFAMRAGFYESLLGISSRERVPLLLEEFGPGFPVERFVACYRAHRTALLPVQIPLRPGVAELLARIVLPMAIATSASRATATAHLRRAGIAHHFAALVTRDDVERGKPAPDAFLEAARRLGVRPNCCVAVEDSVSGASAALAAGMQVLMVSDEAPAALRERCLGCGTDLYAVAQWLPESPAATGIPVGTAPAATPVDIRPFDAP
jgi:HAD superfamily hydrolase (TIGR01509 family)